MAKLRFKKDKTAGISLKAADISRVAKWKRRFVVSVVVNAAQLAALAYLLKVTNLL